jgi:hypothetical protein
METFFFELHAYLSRKLAENVKEIKNNLAYNEFVTFYNLIHLLTRITAD